jgi:RNA recognition motif-containing protein
MGPKIFVGNLSPDTTEQELREAFAGDNRQVRRVRIVIYPRGFAFVEMANAEEAEAAITALNGRSLRGRDLRVSRAGDQPGRDRVSSR